MHPCQPAALPPSTRAQVPGLLLVLQDMLLSVLQGMLPPPPAYHPPTAARALRLGLFSAATLLALTAYRVLGSVLSLAGGLASISCSLLLPAAFYAALAWPRLRWPARAGLAALLTLGVALSALITALNMCDMVPRCAARRHGGGGGTSGGALAAAVAAWGT